MGSEPSALAARAQLAAFASDPEALAPWPIPREAVDAATARPAAVLVLFGVLDDVPAERRDPALAVSRDLDVLLLARATTLRSHAGQVAFPGGRIDAGDADPVAAALREAREETGLDPAGVEVLGSLGLIPVPPSGHLVTPVIGWWAQPTPVAAVDVAESALVFRMPVAELLDPANRRSTVMRRGDLTWRGPGFLVEASGTTQLVWGFTAMVLDRMFDRLGWTEPWDRDRLHEIGDPAPRSPRPDLPSLD
ncbi:NUDIX hydrolase [Agromyces seonyuensis]|uniref:NUDIX domain-containing protein n=1 Tax=Agromyces seonyuensis TaxID=2662446 RepID=A0A6I4P3T6_9MICO|nr:CoA pyrophosphatase [Agromyces seonyuensis]MWB99535.1 NUDIX domain-containing protein [Agromyces seonyuensis]